MSEIRHLLKINTPASAVYQALTHQAGLQQWWTPETTAMPVVGSVNEFNFGPKYHNKMKVIRLEPDRAVEWECLEGDKEWIGTTFHFLLEEDDDGQSTLRFTHGNWREPTDFLAHCNYKWGYYMRSLKFYCETGKGTPFQPDA